MNPVTFHHRLRPQAATIRGFSLVELMVTMVIVAILAALALTGLAGVRQRAKIDKTRSTIRKLHEIVIPQYEAFLTRRVRTAGSHPGVQWRLSPSPPSFQPAGTTMASSTSVPSNRLWGLRVLMALELPDQWIDVAPSSPVAVPSWAVTPRVKRYASYKGAVLNTAYEGAECLAMIVMRGGFDADLVETFRADEIGDLDQDQRPEFLDGWGKPIGFIRAPVGFSSPLLVQDVDVNPDPLDPMRQSASVAYPVSNQTDYGVFPLIYSGGPDGALDVSVAGPSAATPNYGGYAAAPDVTGSCLGQLGLAAGSITIPNPVPSNRLVPSGIIRPGSAVDLDAVRDNITNYDFLKK